MRGEAQQGSTSLEEAEFRRVLGHLATGVTVVTAIDPAGPAGAVSGLTATAVASLSLDPPLVLVCVDRAADTHGAILRAGSFAINVLDERGEALARRFATYPGPEKFEGVAWRRAVTGAPVLERALAWTDCELCESHEGGDHTICVGRVVAGEARDGAPLLYFRGGYGRLST